MKILTAWLRSLLPTLPVDDRQLAEDLTLRGIAVEGTEPASCGGTLFEMDITTNRVDAMNHYGVAREVAAMYDLRLPSLTEDVAAELPAAADGEPYPVRIEAQDLCGHFTARVIRGISVGPAGGDIATYFAALGQKPISAPVDATNFGWLLMGQPTHVFDLDKIEGAIVVRRAHAGERLRLLDGTERTLTADDLVVADEAKALGLAGVMGGWDSRVTEETRNVLVEAAWFLPAAVRASSRRHLLHTDASHRFERGADFAAAPIANNLVTRLIVEQCGGVVTGPMTQVSVPALAAATVGRAPAQLRVPRVQHLLGRTLEDTLNTTTGEPKSALTAALIRRYLQALGCDVEFANGITDEPAAFHVVLPSWRLDLEREIDLIEEVARVYGYNGFANTLPQAARAVDELPHARAERALRAVLRSFGYAESLSSTFVSAAEAETFGAAGAGTVAVGNPLSEEAGMLRPSLVPGIVRALAENDRRDVHVARLFELGTVFHGSTEVVHETTSLGIGLLDDAAQATSLYTAADAPFFELKGVLEGLLAEFASPGCAVTFAAGPLPAWIETGRGAVALLGGKRVAVFGELTAAERTRLKLRTPAAVAAIEASKLFAGAVRQPLAHEISRFQPVVRDWSFLMPDHVSWATADAAVRALGVAELRSVAPLEIFRDAKGKSVSAGEYSLLLRTIFQADDRTLTEEELAGWGERVVSSLTALGGRHRA